MGTSLVRWKKMVQKDDEQLKTDAEKKS